MKSVASATITLGMVAIPVKFFLAAAGKSVSFRLLTPEKNRVKMQFVDAVTGVVIDRKECSRAYEVNKNVSVEFSEEELKSLGEDDNGSFEVDSFVPKADFDPIRVEKSYFVGPDKGAERPYNLLLEVLKRTEKMFIARWTNRGKRHVMAVVPREDVLVAHQLYLDHEVRSLSFRAPVKALSDAELDMGVKLIGSYSKPSFDLSSYEDDHQKRVDAIVEKKLAGEEYQIPAVAPQRTIIDLLEALKQSIAKTTE